MRVAGWGFGSGKDRRTTSWYGRLEKPPGGPSAGRSAPWEGMVTAFSFHGTWGVRSWEVVPEQSRIQMWMQDWDTWVRRSKDCCGSGGFEEEEPKWCCPRGTGCCRGTAIQSFRNSCEELDSKAQGLFLSEITCAQTSKLLEVWLNWSRHQGRQHRGWGIVFSFTYWHLKGKTQIRKRTLEVSSELSPGHSFPSIWMDSLYLETWQQPRNQGGPQIRGCCVQELAPNPGIPTREAATFLIPDLLFFP